MRTYEEAWTAARDRAPFSNGTEGYGWMAAWCERPCVHDSPALVNAGKGCPLISVASLGRTPAEWLDGPRDAQGRRGIADRYTCIDFRSPDDPGAEPTPVRTPPGQGELFDPEPYRGVRMYAGLTKETDHANT